MFITIKLTLSEVETDIGQSSQCECSPIRRSRVRAEAAEVVEEVEVAEIAPGTVPRPLGEAAFNRTSTPLKRRVAPVEAFTASATISVLLQRQHMSGGMDMGTSTL